MGAGWLLRMLSEASGTRKKPCVWPPWCQLGHHCAGRMTSETHIHRITHSDSCFYSLLQHHGNPTGLSELTFLQLGN